MVAQNTLPTCKGNRSFYKINFKSDTAFDVNIRLKQTKLPISISITYHKYHVLSFCFIIAIN